MHLIDRETLDRLIELADRAVVLYGTADVQLWQDLSQAVLMARLETMDKADLIGIAPALESCID